MSKRIRAEQLKLFADAPLGVPTPLSRGTARRRASSPAPLPWQCVVLAIDTARISGWSITAIGKLVGSGEVDTLGDEANLDQIVATALDVAELRAVPLVLVLEAPYGGSVVIVSALGAARERWQRAWRRAGQSLGRVVKVMPSSWRAPVLGPEWVGATRDAVRAQEQRVASVKAGRAVGGDEAPAILIGVWASHAAIVGRAIGARARKASLRVWTKGKGNEP